MSRALAVELSDLVMAYGGRDGVRALDGIDLEVPEGTVMGLLGPNGAGKTTVVRIVTALLRPTAGRVRVPVSAWLPTRCECGSASVFRANTLLSTKISPASRTCAWSRGLYGMSKRSASDQASGCWMRSTSRGRKMSRAGTYSGGMRRRLDLAGALVAKPSLVVLDEPTTGLDPRARQGMWRVISGLVSDGTTVLLTTQYLEEADQLAEKITVIDRGKVIASGRPDELKSTIGGETLTVSLASAADVPVAVRVLGEVGIGKPSRDPQSNDVTVVIEDGSRTMVEALRRLSDADVHVTDARLRRPSLDDVFFALTGEPAAVDSDSEFSVTREEAVLS